LHVESRRIRDLRKEPAVLVPYLDLQLAPAGYDLDAIPECLRKLLDRSDNPLSRLPVDEKNSGKGEKEFAMFLQCHAPCCSSFLGSETKLRNQHPEVDIVAARLPHDRSCRDVYVCDR
jgi:hypothetical protein